MLARRSFWILLGLWEGPPTGSSRGCTVGNIIPNSRVPFQLSTWLISCGKVVLNWALQHGVSVIPASKDEKRQRCSVLFCSWNLGTIFNQHLQEFTGSHSPETNSLPLNIGHPKWKFHFLNHWFSKTMFILGRVGLLFRISSRWAPPIGRFGSFRFGSRDAVFELWMQFEQFTTSTDQLICSYKWPNHYKSHSITLRWFQLINWIL